MGSRGLLAAIGMLLGLANASCVATEETTPRGFVIAPSVPADAGATTLASDGGGSSSSSSEEPSRAP